MARRGGGQREIFWNALIPSRGAKPPTPPLSWRSRVVKDYYPRKIHARAPAACQSGRVAGAQAPSRLRACCHASQPPLQGGMPPPCVHPHKLQWRGGAAADEHARMLRTGTKRGDSCTPAAESHPQRQCRAHPQQAVLVRARPGTKHGARMVASRSHVHPAQAAHTHLDGAPRASILTHAN